MSTPRVTVLMSVYNGERYLRESIESILLQKFSDFEFLIINDGSTDSSVNIIQSCNDPRIRLIHNDRNLGLAVSLNIGMELARGEFIARMDADDISRPERLSFQLKFMDANRQVGVCGSWVKFFPNANNCVWKLPEKSEEIRCWQFHAVGVAHPTVMMRRSCFADNGLLYNPQFRFSQDYELWGRAIRHMEFANIQKVLLDYRTGPEQICVLHSAEQLAAVAPLRLQRVRELGIEPTPEQLLLHEMIINGTMPPESECLDRAEQWLLRLESANREVGTYSTVLFSRRLLEIWFSICLNFSDMSLCPLRRCLKSNLWAATNASLWHQMRAVGAWLMSKGAWETICGIRHV